MKRPEFKFYATLLDSFRNYIESDNIWEEYWGWSENPPFTPDEFHEKKYKELIDKINRVPTESSEAADNGTAFNEVIDCMILNRNSTKMKITKVYDDERNIVGLNALYNERKFFYPINLIREVAEKYKGGLPQQYVEGILQTTFGNVLLYGYIDYLMPFSVNDLKTTGRYNVGKFRHNNQHLVYPFALSQNGIDVKEFAYDIVIIGKTSYDIFKEIYVFDKERDTPVLIERVEDFIKFLNQNRDKITDKKIFGLDEQ